MAGTAGELWGEAGLVWEGMDGKEGGRNDGTTCIDSLVRGVS